MTSHELRAARWWFVLTNVVLAATTAQPVLADIDLNGPWGLVVELPVSTTRCLVDVAQTGGTLAIAGHCFTNTSVSLSGTIDTVGGTFSASGSASSSCTTVTLTGTASPSSDGFAGTLICDAETFSFTASRCGNGMLDPGEECDGVTYTFRLNDDPCCSSTCTAEPAGMACGTATACSAPLCDGTGTCTRENEAAGTACESDDNVCTDDVCDSGGVCAHRPNTAPCSDGNFCTEDRCVGGVCQSTCSLCCDASAGCTPMPAVGCKEPTVPTGPLTLRLDSIAGNSQRLGWKWKRGAATGIADFGDPRTSTDYAFCVYRRRPPGGAIDLLLAANAKAGTGCLHGSVTMPCWQQQGGSGFVYKNPAAASQYEGLKKITLRAGGSGQARVTVDGKGPRLRSQLYPGLDPVVAQVRASNGQCWEAGYVDAERDRFGFVGMTEALDYQARRSSPSGAFLDVAP